jgi:putative sterol carrier protein
MATDTATRFFDALAHRGHEPLLRKVSGRTRFEIVDGSRTRRWCVEIDKGDVTVEAGSGDADCIVRADRKVFEGVVTGRTNAVAAVLRGEIVVEGDWKLLVAVKRLFAGPAKRKSPA